MEKQTKGTILCVLAYFFWGLTPFFWKLLNKVPPFELIAHRVLWSFLLAYLILKFKNIKLNKYFKNTKLLLMISLCGFFVIINWSLYIYLVSIGNLLECSLGYYINPLISILLGVSLLKEKLSILDWIAVCFAFLGVMYKSIILGTVPIYALILALTFGFYGLIKKKIKIEATESLFLETLFFIPFIISYLLFLKINNNIWFLSSSLYYNILLIFAGVITFIPLYLFSKSTLLVSLNKIGFFQYIVPTMFFIEGIMIFGEKFSLNDLIPFVLIWTGIGIYIYSEFKRNRKKFYHSIRESTLKKKIS